MPAVEGPAAAAGDVDRARLTMVVESNLSIHRVGNRRQTCSTPQADLQARIDRDRRYDECSNSTASASSASSALVLRLAARCKHVSI